LNLLLLLLLLLPLLLPPIATGMTVLVVVRWSDRYCKQQIF
jgi:ABC-type spermidine/putrescine transport system permease subunit II